MPYKLSQFGEIEKPQIEYSSVQPGKIITDIPHKLSERLKTVGGGKYDDASRQDSSDITALLRYGIKPWDVYATFAASPRGKDALERKTGHFDDYMQRTIRNSLAFLNPGKETFEPSPAVQKTNGHGRKLDIDFSKRQKRRTQEGIYVTRTSRIEVEKTHWLWEGYIPVGKITILAGDPGKGKSTIGIDLASRISRGSALPFGHRTINGTCLIASAEDAPEDTVTPRLIAAGADLHRVWVMRGVTIDGEFKTLSFPRDIGRLHDKVVEMGARLLVIDPLNAFLSSGSDSYKDQDIRGALAPVELLAQETSVAVLIIAHLNKREDANIMYRVGGSIGLVGAARSVLGVSDMSGDRKVVFSIKSNLAKKPPSLAYRTRQITKTKGVDGNWEGDEVIASSGIRWTGAVDFDPAVSLGSDLKKVAAEGETFLRTIITDAPMKASEIFAEARRVGISRGVLNRLRTELGVKISRDRAGEWLWEL